MILNKKGLAVLPIAALLFSCGAKKISYEQAKKFVEENYKATEVKTSTGGHLKIEGKAADDASKKDLKALIKKQFDIDLKDDLKADQDYKGKEEMEPLNAKVFEDSMSEDFDFSLNGKELTIKYAAGEMWGHNYTGGTVAATCDKDGYPYKLDADVEYKESNISWSFCAIITLNY